MRPYLLEMVQMNICELLLSAFGIWHVESEDAKNRPLCFLTSEFLASITVSPPTHTQKTSNYNMMKITKAVMLSGSYCKSGCNVSLVLKVHTVLEILQAF